jgi:uncharacterized protein
MLPCSTPVGLGGPFVDNDLPAELDMIDLNVKSTVHLAKRVLGDMVARNEGRVLDRLSTVPGGFQAVYEGTKSFLQSFAEAVANDLKARTDGTPDYLCLSPEWACLPGTKP